MFYILRDDETSAIVNALKIDQGNPVSGKRCFIQGSQGMGKTDLCRAVSFRLSDEFSDGQIYLKIEESDLEHVSLFKIFESIVHIFDPYAHISDDLETSSNEYKTVCAFR